VAEPVTTIRLVLLPSSSGSCSPRTTARSRLDASRPRRHRLGRWLPGAQAAPGLQVGKILDPVADRLLVMVGLLAVAAAAGVPWWFAIATLARELLVSA